VWKLHQRDTSRGENRIPLSIPLSLKPMEAESVTDLPRGNKRLGVWQYGMDHSRAPMVTHLSLGEKKDDWPANAIADRVQLGVQPAFRAADATG
jgi:hypothetical protein